MNAKEKIGTKEACEQGKELFIDRCELAESVRGGIYE